MKEALQGYLVNDSPKRIPPRSISPDRSQTSNRIVSKVSVNALDGLEGILKETEESKVDNIFDSPSKLSVSKPTTTFLSPMNQSQDIIWRPSYVPSPKRSIPQ
jgi:hypothetical protein